MLGKQEISPTSAKLKTRCLERELEKSLRERLVLNLERNINVFTMGTA